MKFKIFDCLVMAWICLFTLTGSLWAQDAQTLLTFEDPFEVSSVKTDNAYVERAIVDGKAVLEFTTEKASYPGITLENNLMWDAGDATGLSFVITNIGQQNCGVHCRVDNPGAWGKAPTNTSQTSLIAGASTRVKVIFGKNYGHDAKMVDAHQIVRMLIFVPNAKGGEKIRLSAIERITGQQASPSSSDSASSSNQGQAFRPGIEGILCDFDKTYNPSLIKTEQTSFELVDGADGKAMKLTIPADKSYPGVRFDAPKGAWDLSDFAGIQATITNHGEKAIRVFLRMDNKGAHDKSPWNTSFVTIKPGQTKDLQGVFGKNNDAPGFPLNAARVIGALFFTDRTKAQTSLTIDNIKAFGSPAPKFALNIPMSGEMESFEETFDINTRTKAQGAKGVHSKGKVEITFDGSEKWPSFSIFPAGKSWDLKNFESVQMQMTNTGQTAAQFGMRVDNPGADGQKNCNTENITLKPGETQTIKVTFGKSWGNKGFDLDTSNVVNIMVIGPGKEAMVTVDNLKANRLQWAELPQWLGKKPPVEGDWVVTLNEDFTESTLNKNIWNTRMRYDGPLKGELQVYSENNLTIKDGNLEFLCEKKHGHQYDNPKLPTRDYTTAVIQSFDKFTQKYGYFESRFKAPTARGLWPAFWLMPDRGPEAGDIWKRGATEKDGMEYDIYEYLCEWGPGRYNVALHWDGYGDNHKSWGTSELYHLPTQDGYHTFGMLWEPGRTVFYCDGIQMAEYKNERVGSTAAFIILNVQTGRWATKDIDDSALPDKWLVDYVRVWQLKDRIK